MESFQMIAKTFQGLEEVLAQELTALGANDIEIGRRMVSFSGDKEMMYKANFCLRTAIRILKPIKNFTAKNADEVYEQIKAISWENILDVEKTFAVDAVVFSEEFRHSKFVSYKVKDAIVDYFREKFNKRPSVRINRPDVLLNIHIAQTTCTLSLDSSGESLHRRGYRHRLQRTQPFIIKPHYAYYYRRQYAHHEPCRKYPSERKAVCVNVHIQPERRAHKQHERGKHQPRKETPESGILLRCGGEKRVYANVYYAHGAKLAKALHGVLRICKPLRQPLQPRKVSELEYGVHHI